MSLIGNALGNLECAALLSKGVSKDPRFLCSQLTLCSGKLKERTMIEKRNRIWKATVLFFLAFVCFYPNQLLAQSREPDHGDVVYATVDGKSLGLDIYLPDGVEIPPLLVWIHGGAWSRGSKKQVPSIFVENGLATASLDYRLSTEARFPAQVHDIKAAIRFLRAKGPKYRFRTDRIAIAGASAGGHLAALVGVTNGHAVLEGEVGGYLNESSAVQAILSYYGASNLTSILRQSTPWGLQMRQPALNLLLGAQPEDAVDLAKLASPVFHVDASDPPLLLLHGDQDPQMPINQSHELEGAYHQHGLDVFFDVVHGGWHGGDAFYSGDHLARALSFLNRTIRQ
jgi:acetyl esterase/lipase